VSATPAGPRLPLREQFVRGERTLVAAAVLAVVAALTQWLAWLEGVPERVDTFVGPPRSDYTLRDYQLTSYDEQGRRRFTVESPRLVKHPELDTFDIDTPSFRLWDGRQRGWTARSQRGWVRADAKALRLSGAVAVDRVAAAGVEPLALRTDSLDALLDSNHLRAPGAVTITQPGSILRGTGLEADLDAERYVLEQQVTAQYDPKIKPLL
jgi:lipopolysaccharide export system protein LptC